MKVGWALVKSKVKPAFAVSQSYDGFLAQFRGGIASEWKSQAIFLHTNYSWHTGLY